MSRKMISKVISCMLIAMTLLVMFLGSMQTVLAESYKYGDYVGEKKQGKITHRAWIGYTITETETTYTVTVNSGIFAWNQNWGVDNVTCTLTDQSNVKKDVSKFNMTDDAKKRIKFFSSKKFVYTKTHDVQSKTITATSKIPNVSNGDKSTAKLTLKIPAKKSYKVTYYPNGGTGAPAAQTKWYGETLKLTTGQPTRSGYTFQGWATSATATAPNTSYNGGKDYTGNAALNLYAVWKAIPVAVSKVTYNANDGTLASPHASAITVAADGSINESGAAIVTQFNADGASVALQKLNNSTGVNLARMGYHIDAGEEWNELPDGEGRSYNQNNSYTQTDFPANVTLYANWKPNTYTVSFYPNASGTTGAMPDQTLTYDKSEKIMFNSFINPGFKLVGWDTNPNANPSGSLTVRGDSGTVLNLASEQGRNIRLYAIWRPIEESQTDIYVGKIVKGENPATDTYSFMIEPVEGWIHENESTSESGASLEAGELPMPEGTPEDQEYKIVEVNGLANNAGVLRSSSVGLINFENPGWYMYKISEVVPSPSNPKIKYDRTSYYVVVYVEYKEDTGYKIKVSNTTAWHNTRGSTKNRPNLEDISEISDNNGKAAVANTEGVYGKVGIGEQGVLVRFWNEEDKDPPNETSFRISKNVTGSLGDLTKKFEFTASVSGLAANTTYSINNEGAALGTGFTGNAFRTNASGQANLYFKLSDDDGFSVDELPLNAYINVFESESDHNPSFTVTTDDGTVVKQGSLNRHGDLSTGIFQMSSANDMYNIVFTNSRDITTNTGIAERGIPIAAGAVTIVGIIAFLLLTVRRRRKTIEQE